MFDVFLGLDLALPCLVLVWCSLLGVIKFTAFGEKWALHIIQENRKRTREG